MTDMRIPRFDKALMLAQLAALSMMAMITMASGHEVRPAIADVRLSETQVHLDIRLTSEALVAGIDLEGLQDVNQSPESAEYDSLRALTPQQMAAELQAAWAEIAEGIQVLAGDMDVALELLEVDVTDQPNVELPRDTEVRLQGSLPADGSDIRVGWTAAYGPLIVRQSGAGDDAYAGYLDGGALSDPLPRVGAASQSAFSVFVRYIGVGFDHIIPKGLDHILFVLGLFFLSLRMGSLVTQVTVFTVAHTITLALASLGYIAVSPAIVEPLIAASIVYVAVENVLTNKITWWRPVIIFAFGLLHGLGFASVLDEFGLLPGQFIAGLIGFNVGVEVGQLTVIGLAFLAVGYWFGKKPWYRARVSVPASVGIAIVGGYWAIERVFL